MKIVLTILLTGVILTFQWGCSNPPENSTSPEYWTENNSIVFDDQLSFSKDSILSFPIDSNISLSRVKNIQYTRLSGTNLIYFYYYRTNQIYFLSFDNKIRKVISFPREGSGSITPHESNKIFVKSLTEAIIYERATRKLKAFKDERLITICSLPDLEEIIADSLSLGYMGYGPAYMDEMSFRDSVIYMSLTQHNPDLINKGYTSIRNILTYDLRTSEFNSFLELPDFYYGNFWGESGSLKAHVFQCIHQEQSVFGFTAQSGVWFKTDTTDLEFKFLGSKYFKRVEPAPVDLKGRKNVENWRWMLTTPFYEDILFNKATEHYYRFVFHGTPIDQYDLGLRNGDYSIIIFDKKGEKLGEVLLENGLSQYDIYKSFVANGLLHIMRKDLYHNKSDDFFYYEQFREIDL